MTKKKRPRRSQPGRSAGGSRQREAAARARAASTAAKHEAGAESAPAEAGREREADATFPAMVPGQAPGHEVESEAEDLEAQGEELEPEGESAAEEPPPARPRTFPSMRSGRARPNARTRDRGRTQAPVGLFGGLRAPSPFPLFRVTVMRAAAVIASSPALVVLPLLMVLGLWLLLLAVGLDHVPLGFMDLLAIPPIGSFFDLNIAGTVSPRGAGSIALLFGLTVLRAVILALLVTLIVEGFDGKRASSLTMARALRALPATVAYCVATLLAIYVAQYLSLVLGSLGGLISIIAYVGALYFLVFIPVAAVHGFVPFREALRRSVAAARLPGSRHVGLVMLYFFIMIVPLQYSLQSPGPFSANPSIREWVIVLGMTLVHVLFLAAFSYRYITVESEIPEAAARPVRPPRRSR
jgi:hypothetical protein